jgi:hypothetical protein
MGDTYQSFPGDVVGVAVLCEEGFWGGGALCDHSESLVIEIEID